MQSTRPQQIAERILADLRASHRLHAGTRIPTVRDLERRFDASRGTIVHALGLLQQQGWVENRHGSGCYVVEHFEESKTRSSRLIGFLCANAGGEVQVRMQNGMERMCRLHGYQMAVFGTDNDYDAERQAVECAIHAGCKAIVLLPVSRRRSQLAADYLLTECLDFPIVLVDIAYPQQGRPQVVFDNYRAGYEMTDLLLREGHRRIAFMDMGVGDDTVMHYSTRERYRGYCAAIQAAGLPRNPDDHWVQSDPDGFMNSEKHVLPTLTRWRETPDRPTAVIAIEDCHAILVIAVAQRIGIRVPEDLRVAGFDNAGIAQSFMPPFPSTYPDFARAGEIAADIGVRMIDAPAAPPVVYMLPAPVIRRDRGEIAGPEARPATACAVAASAYPARGMETP